MQQQGRILDGDLETLGLQATLKMLALSGKTGTLIVTSGQETLSICLNKGQIAALQEQPENPVDLVEMLRLLGRIDGQQARELLQRVDPTSPAVLETLVDYRVIREAEWLGRLEFRLIQAMSRALRWQQGRFEFHRNMLAREVQLALNVDHVLLEGLRQADEWDEASATGLNRSTVARWAPEFDGNVKRLNLENDAVNVLCLANGQLSLQAIAYGLLYSEARVAMLLAQLLESGVIEVVDEVMEVELERNLMNVLTASQHELTKQPQGSPDQRLLVLIKTLSTCTNGLLAHHGMYARELRGRGALRPRQMARYLEQGFGPLLGQVQAQWPIFETVVFSQGQLDCGEILTLHTLVKGEQLQDFYWNVVDGFLWLMRQVCTTILQDEIGNSRSGRQFLGLWKTFLHEIDEEIAQNQLRRKPPRARAERSGGWDERKGETAPRLRQIASDPRLAQVSERKRLGR